jgi:peptidoglycan biosynthesis protein MviN/MurJ (putative lipid II flippase)
VAALLRVMVVRHFGSTLVYALFAFGYERRLAIAGILDGVVTVAGAVLLVPRLGAVGAALASLVGACAIALPTLVPSLARETGVSARRFAATLVPWLWRFVLALSIAILVNRFLPPRTLVAAAALAALTLVPYGLLVRSLLARGPLRLYVPPRLAFLVGT